MLKDKLQADQLTALKSGDKKTLDVLRFLLAQIKNKEIDKQSDLTDEEAVTLLRKQIKELQESIDAFTKGARPDLVTEYEAQKRVVEQYVPAQMTNEDLASEIKKIVEANQEMYQKNPKTIIGVCMKELKNKADSSRIIKVLHDLYKV